jgi:hypothetical protein
LSHGRSRTRGKGVKDRTRLEVAQQGKEQHNPHSKNENQLHCKTEEQDWSKGEGKASLYTQGVLCRIPWNQMEAARRIKKEMESTSRQKVLEDSRTNWYIVEHDRTPWNFMECCGNIWKLLETYGT